jgi:hypothetical protein
MQNMFMISDTIKLNPSTLNTSLFINMNKVQKERKEILKVMNKGRIMDNYEKYYTHKYSKMGVNINERHITGPNVLFDILHTQSRKVGSTDTNCVQ